MMGNVFSKCTHIKKKSQTRGCSPNALGSAEQPPVQQSLVTNTSDTVTAPVPASSDVVEPTVSFPDGVKVWHNCTDAKVDVCFVHGLTGNRDSTWTADGQNEPWPPLLLAPQLPGTRLLTYGYDAYVVKKAVAATSGLTNHAVNFLGDLVRDRRKANAKGRPLIFVAHSLGGLVCKEAILLSRDHPEEHLRDVFDSFKGIVFMGTPHEGSWMARWAKIPAKALGLVKSTNRNLLDILRADNELLKSSQMRFWSMLRGLRESGRKVEATCFYEELGMPVVGFVVPKESATVESFQAISIHANHSGMAKFASEDDNGFQRVHGELERWMGNISTRVQSIELNKEHLKFLEIFNTIEPYFEMERILADKGGLLEGSCDWILEHVNKWYKAAEQKQLLWIHGEPGKGKTMLLCGIIYELQKQAHPSITVSYFFCQGTISQINNATAVLRGLIYLLLKAKQHIIPKLHNKCQTTNRDLLTNVDAWVPLSEILVELLQDPDLGPVYIIIDGLDECLTGLEKLLTFLVAKTPAFSGVKWIFSSRPWPEIGERLHQATNLTELSLEEEQNAVYVRSAVESYIERKVDELLRLKGYDEVMERTIRNHLVDNADGTFLWVALVYEELSQTSRFNAMTKLLKLPNKLDGLFQVMLNKVANSDDSKLCIPVLSFMAHAYGPPRLCELTYLVENLEGRSERDGAIFFVHQSAKDFLLLPDSLRRISPDGSTAVHRSILLKALQLMDDKLKYNMYGIPHPGTLIHDVVEPKDSVLAAMRYSCTYWIKHASNSELHIELTGDGCVFSFLSRHFLHWLESLSLLRTVAEGVLFMEELLESVQSNGHEDDRLRQFLEDAHSFVKNCSIMEAAPLQIYGGALVFHPRKSHIWRLFSTERLKPVENIQGVDERSNPYIQVLKGHTDCVLAVAFSPDDKLLASTSWDGTLRVWKISTGACIHLLNSKSYKTVNIQALTFSPNGNLVAWASDENKICLWDVSSGNHDQSFTGHTHKVTTLTFSPNGEFLVSGSRDETVRIWALSTGKHEILRGHHSEILCSAFSRPDGKKLATGANTSIKIWNFHQGTGTLIQTIHYSVEGLFPFLSQLVFTSEKTVISLCSHVMQEWDIDTRACLREGKIRFLRTMSADASILAVGGNQLALLKPSASAKPYSYLIGDYNRHLAMSLSASGKFLACVRNDNDKRIHIWNAKMNSPKPLPYASISCLAFSPDGSMLASISTGAMVKIWDTKTKEVLRILSNPGKPIFDRLSSGFVVFSPDGRMLAAAIDDEVHVWSKPKYEVIARLKLNAPSSLLFSPDCACLAVLEEFRNATIWDIAEEKCIKTFEIRGDFLFNMPYIPHERIVKPRLGNKFPTLISSVYSPREYMDWGSLFYTPDGIHMHWEEEIFVQGHWIARHGQKVLWLPPDYRPKCTALYDNLLVLGLEDGRLIWIEFSPSQT
ncbi:hypothetical protein F5Y13DRAFT_199892 [Hypoxylon sp. FL1857]|nr:hypothetical protein F5Y13DRAFT_199892 [Hypoxylon sp. FL1857]